MISYNPSTGRKLTAMTFKRITKNFAMSQMGELRKMYRAKKYTENYNSAVFDNSSHFHRNASQFISQLMYDYVNIFDVKLKAN